MKWCEDYENETNLFDDQREKEIKLHFLLKKISKKDIDNMITRGGPKSKKK